MIFDSSDIECKKIEYYRDAKYYCQRCDFVFTLYKSGEFFIKSDKKSIGGVSAFDSLCQCPKCDLNNRLMFFERIRYES